MERHFNNLIVFILISYFASHSYGMLVPLENESITPEDLEEVVSVENRNNANWDQLNKSEYSVDALRKRTSIFMENLSQERKMYLFYKFQHGRRFTENEVKRLSPKEKEFFEYMQVWERNNFDYFAKYDSLVNKKHLTLVLYTWNWIEKIYSFLKNDEQLIVQDEFNAIKESKNLYVNSLDYYGTPYDNKKRMDPFRRFFIKAEDFFRKWNGEIRTPRRKLNTQYDLPHAQIDFGSISVVRALGSVLGLYTTLVYTKLSSLRPRERGILETTSFMKLIKKIQHISGIDVEIIGKEHIPQFEHYPPFLNNPESQRPYFFQLLVSHRSGLRDVVAMENLSDTPAFVFANGYRILGDFLGKKLDDTKTILVADKPRNKKNKKVYPNTLEKYFNHALKGYANVTGVFPQGAEPLTGEILPIRKKFNWGTSYGMVQMGFHLVTVPIAIDTPSRFLNYHNEAPPCKAKITVMKPISLLEYAIWSIYGNREATGIRIVPLPKSSIMDLQERKRQEEQNDKKLQIYDLVIRSLWKNAITQYPDMSFDDLKQRILSKFRLDVG